MVWFLREANAHMWNAKQITTPVCLDTLTIIMLLRPYKTFGTFSF